MKGIYAIINLTANQKEGFYENRKNSGSSLAAAALCLSVCSAAFAAPAVKTFDVHEGSVKIEVPQIKGAAGGKFADNKINNTLNFYVLKQLYTALPLSMRNDDVMRTAYDKTFKAKDGSEDAREFVEDVAETAAKMRVNLLKTWPVLLILNCAATLKM